MKLHYWIAEHLCDSREHSLRATTKKEVVSILEGEDVNPTFFGPVHRVTVEYSSGFDLLDQCLGNTKAIDESYHK